LNSGKNTGIGKILEIVVPKIINIWKTSCIPTMSYIRICNMIKMFKKITVIEENIFVLQEPGLNYLEHITIEKSTTKEVKKINLNYLSTKYGTKDLIAIGCDSTIVNTGYKAGAIRLKEHTT
jgi:hypothetical protein